MTAAGNVLVALSALLATTCAVTYHLLAHWRASVTGWHLMSFMAVLALALDLMTLRIFIPIPATGIMPGWYPVTRAAVLVLVAAVLAWRLAIIVRAHAQARREREGGGLWDRRSLSPT